MTQTGEKVKFTFVTPEDIQLVGSFQLNTQSKGAMNVDVAVVIPKKVFKDRDIHSHLYFDKRTLYLGVIAKALLGKKETEKPKFVKGKKKQQQKQQEQQTPETNLFQNVALKGFRGDAYKPYLEVRPFVSVKKGEKEKLSRFIVNIYPVVDQSLFPKQKLLPSKT